LTRLYRGMVWSPQGLTDTHQAAGRRARPRGRHSMALPLRLRELSACLLGRTAMCAPPHPSHKASRVAQNGRWSPAFAAPMTGAAVGAACSTRDRCGMSPPTFSRAWTATADAARHGDRRHCGRHAGVVQIRSRALVCERREHPRRAVSRTAKPWADVGGRLAGRGQAHAQMR
jgi:hypothetical protein